MFDIIPYTPERCNEWNAFVAQSKNGTFLFDRGYMDYHSDRFADFSLMCYFQGKLFALLPANRVGETLYSHQGLSYGGLVMDSNTTTAKTCQLFNEINDYLRGKGICKVVYKPVPHIYHRLPAEEDLYAIYISCGATLAGRDVSSALLPAKPVKWKRDRHYNAKHARKKGVVARQTDDFETFWQLLSDNLWQKFGVHPVHSLQEIRLLHSRFPENIQLWAAYSPEGGMLAGTVLYLCGDVVHTQYISASPEGKRLHAVDGLFYHLINNELADIQCLDMGTSNMPHSSDLHESLIFQKEGFGGRAVCCDTYEWNL
ncbi:MAG: GNAT family N-acetyltransferase [Prevotella sp.]|nr:GNAT family N-acetyltransferase [Prevotella sp.]